MTRLGTITAACAAALALASCAGEAPDAAADAGGGVLASMRAVGAPDPVVPGEIVVKFRAGVDVVEAARGHGLAVAAAGHGQAFHVLAGAVGNEHALAARLAGDADVEWAEPNYLRQADAIDARLWAFYNPGGLNMRYTSGKNNGKPLPSTYASLADADLDNVEGYAAGGSPVVIGSVDTGVQLDHPEFLAGQLLAGRDWYNDDADPTDDEGHGTHTTGTMAGRSVGVAGVSGAGPNVQVYVQKVCGRRGCPSAAIASAIRAAADQAGMVAMNLSLGGTSESTAEADAIAYAVNTKGVLVIASAGNSGSGTVACPACDPLAISVAATDWRDQKASYSQYGPGLDISAPGGGCYSNTSQEGCIYSAYLGSGYTWMQGTSMAAPQVTGTAGIVASKTGLRGAGLRARLLGTADDLGAAGADQTFGAGRLNSYRAVTGGSLPAPQ
jgi:subtilisin family serine protease